MANNRIEPNFTITRRSHDEDGEDSFAASARQKAQASHEELMKRFKSTVSKIDKWTPTNFDEIKQEQDLVDKDIADRKSKVRALISKGNRTQLRKEIKPPFIPPSDKPQRSLGPTAESLIDELGAASLHGGGRSPSRPAQRETSRPPVFGATSMFSGWRNTSPFGSVSAWSQQPTFGSNLPPNFGLMPSSGPLASSTFGAPGQRVAPPQPATGFYGQLGARSSNTSPSNPFQLSSSSSFGHPAGRGASSRRNDAQDDIFNPLADDFIPEGGGDLNDNPDGKRPRSKGSSSLQSAAVRRESTAGIPIIPRDDALDDGRDPTASRSPPKAASGKKFMAEASLQALRQHRSKLGEEIDPCGLPLFVSTGDTLVPIDDMEDQEIAEELQRYVDKVYEAGKAAVPSRHLRWVDAAKNADWCYHALTVGRSRPPKWVKGFKRTRACTTCANAGRPCLIHKDGMVIILPICADEPDWESLRAWVIPENESPKKKKPAQAA